MMIYEDADGELVYVDPDGFNHLISDRHDPENPLADLSYP